VIRLLIVFGTLAAGVSAQTRPAADYSRPCGEAGCHDEFAKRPVVHDPVQQGSCDVCHKKLEGDKHAFQLASKGGKLCTECHEEKPGKVRHSPVADGECTACHDPHGSKTKRLLTAASEGELCLGCHGDVTKDRKYLHGPVGAGECTACHRAHASDQAKLLSAAPKELCLGCHQDVQDRLAARKHKHAPAEDDCTGCHDPHGSNQKTMTTAAVPELCYSCHDAIAEAVKNASVPHRVVAEGDSCAACHDAHASDAGKLLVKDQLSLCLSCHDKAIETKTGKLSDMKKLLADNPQHHGPVAEKSCTECHGKVHGGNEYRLLSAAYPREFYVSYDEKRYALCFGCHEAEAFKAESTDSATGFRNGKQNLHFVHVNRKTKGRSCRACHLVHASKAAKHVADTVPFGQWQIPINFKATDTGGSCRPGCHRAYRYDRESPVANLPGS